MAQFTESLCDEVIRTQGKCGLTHNEMVQLAWIAKRTLAAPQALDSQSAQRTDREPAVAASAVAPEGTSLVCPFCKEPDYDLIGLKRHLSLTGCGEYEETPTFDPRPPQGHRS